MVYIHVPAFGGPFGQFDLWIFITEKDAQFPVGCILKKIIIYKKCPKLDGFFKELVIMDVVFLRLNIAI